MKSNLLFNNDKIRSSVTNERRRKGENERNLQMIELYLGQQTGANNQR